MKKTIFLDKKSDEDTNKNKFVITKFIWFFWLMKPFFIYFYSMNKNYILLKRVQVKMPEYYIFSLLSLFFRVFTIFHHI